MPDKRRFAIAQHAWAPTGGGDNSKYLSFASGDRIEVVEERESGGWWAGRLKGKLGWFPSSFCTIVSDDPEPTLLLDLEPAAAPAAPSPEQASGSPAAAAAASIQASLTASAASAHAAAGRQPADPSEFGAFASAASPPTQKHSPRTGGSDEFVPSPAREPARLAAPLAELITGGAAAVVSPVSPVQAPSPARIAAVHPSRSDQALAAELRSFPKRAALPSSLAHKAAGVEHKQTVDKLWEIAAFADVFADAAGGARLASAAAAAAGTSDGAGQTAAPARGMAPLDGAMRLVLRVLETLNREGEADGRADGTTGRPGTRGGSRCAPLRHAPTDSASCACTGAREGSSPLLSALHRAEEGFRLGLELLKLLKALDTC